MASKSTRWGAAPLSIALATASAAASGAAPAPVLPAIPMPAAYAGLAPEPAAPGVMDYWWVLFGDPRLDALEDEALRASSDSATAAARLLEARATRAADIARTWPGGSIAASASHEAQYGIGLAGNDLNPTAGVTAAASADFNVSWELDLFGRLAVKRRVARASAAQALFDVEGTLASLTAQVADDWVQLEGLKVQRQDAGETVRIDEGLLEVARRKADAGAGAADAVDRVAGQLAQARAQAQLLDAQADSLRRQLLILVGRDLRDTADLPVGEDWPTVPPTPSVIPAQLLARRPDVREAEFRLRAELGSARLAHLAVFPTLTFLPALGLSTTSTPGVSYIPPTTLITSQQVTNTGFWNLAVGLTVPTLDIPRLLQEAKAQDARAREAAIAYQGAVRTAFGEAQNALVTLAADEQAASVLQDGEARAHRAYEAERRRYDHGLDDLTAALTAEQEWRALRSALTTQKVETLRRAVATYKALGGGWAFTTLAVSPAGEGR
jgi:NodT family efflux transporter outer membrane factor (OMF) lipoprotein